MAKTDEVHPMLRTLSQSDSLHVEVTKRRIKQVAPLMQEALVVLERFKEAWGARYPSMVNAWWENYGTLLQLYQYLKPLWPYLRSTNPMERLIREIRRGTKVRDHKLPSEGVIYKLLYPESER